jgi:hypothetical protein
MKNLNTKRIIRFSLVLLLGSSICLFLHLYLIKKSRANQKVFALGRIDFVKASKDENLRDIRNFTAAIPGITNAIYNENDRILVYMYEPKVIDEVAVFYKVKNHSNAIAQRFITPAADLNNGCPVNFNQATLLGKLMSYIQFP